MRSLRGRLVLSVTLVLVLSILLTTLALERAFQEAARSAREERLLAQIYLLMAAAEVEDDQPRLARGAGRAASELSGLRALRQDLRRRGIDCLAVPLRPGRRPAGDSPPGPGIFGATERKGEGGIGFLVAAFGVSWATGPIPIDYTFAVAEDLTALRREVAEFRASLWRWLGAMSLLMLLALGLTLGWGLRPLRRVAAEVAAVESGRQQAIQGVYPAELGVLTDNLNALLAQERARAARLDQALGDLAHSLKTPLAVMLGAVSADRVDPEGVRLLREQLGRVGDILEYQLQRARAGTAPAGKLVPPVPLRRTLERLGATLAKVYRDKSVELELDLEGNPVFLGAEGDLLELLGNLLDNAFKWCRGRVRVSATSRGGRLGIAIGDDGPGIEPAAVERLMERGMRADEGRPGHGLGLAVAREICRAYGGTIAVVRSPLGGAEVRLGFGTRPADA